MKLEKSQLTALLQALEITEDREINCNEFLDLMAEYVELDALGKTTGTKFDKFRQHLDLCAECREEYEALVAVLDSMGECDEPA